MPNNELVILVHGLGRSRFSMRRLEQTLNHNGYTVCNWPYNSLSGTIKSHGERLAQLIQADQKHTHIHGVGHSLGGLILRHAFSFQKERIKRLVTLGTPHHGAGLIARYPLLFKQSIVPEAIKQMHPLNFAALELSIPQIEIGIIAGIQKFHPLNPISWLNCLNDPGIPHDGTVDIESTKIATMSDYLEIEANHSFLPQNPKACLATLNFIRSGMFSN